MERAKMQSFEITGVEIEAPLFEELFSDRPTPGTVIPYANKYSSTNNPRDIAIARHQFAAKRFGARFVHAEVLDEAVKYGFPCHGRRSDPEYAKRGIIVRNMIAQVAPGKSYISLPDQDLPLVHESWGWIMDPRYLKEMSRQIVERARENQYDYVEHFDELWTYLANRPVAKDKWYPEVETVDQEVRHKYGFGKYGMPTSYTDGDPFDRIAYARAVYNAWVTNYETVRQTLPSALVAYLFRFVRREYFEADIGSRAAVAVDLRTP